jgi:hypothetical protein
MRSASRAWAHEAASGRRLLERDAPSIASLVGRATGVARELLDALDGGEGRVLSNTTVP